MNKKLIFSLFTISIVALSACGGGTTEEREDVEDVEIPAVLACEEGQAEYKVTGTPMEFCYDPAWGEIVVEPQTLEKGTATKISFASGQGPQIWYQSSDVEGDFCFSCLNINAPEKQLRSEVTEQLTDVDPEILKVRKSDIFGMRAVRVNDGTTVSYFVPDAFEGYNLKVSSPQEMAADLDEFVYAMIL